MRKPRPMRGMILHDLYSGGASSILTSLGIVVVLGFAWIFTQQPVVLSALIGMTSASIPLSFLPLNNKQNGSKWARYRLVMPMTRARVVMTQFASQLALTLVGVVVIGLVLAVGVFVIGSVEEVYEQASLFLPATGMALLTGALFHPLSYTRFGNKAEMLLLPCLLAAAALMALVMVIGELAGMPTATTNFLCVAVAAVLFVTSFFISLTVYSKRDL